jgi:hypothetical protein
MRLYNKNFLRQPRKQEPVHGEIKELYAYTYDQDHHRWVLVLVDLQDIIVECSIRPERLREG